MTGDRASSAVPDLDAIEQRANYGAWNKRGDVLALVAHCRALRAEVERLTALLRDRENPSTT